ncbi:hypothetical protein QUB25_21245 [Microcoleus sp. B3-D7]
MTVSNQQLNTVRLNLCLWWCGVDCLLVTVPGIIGQSVQVIRAFARLHSQSLASVKQAGKIYIKSPLVSRSYFYLPAETAVHLLFTFPIKATKKPHQVSWVSRFKRQQQELGGIAKQ